MAKVEADAACSARKLWEARELERRKIRIFKKHPKGSLWYLPVVLNLVCVADACTSAMGMLFVDSIDLLRLCICAPFMPLSIILLLTQGHETKGIDLSTVTGAKWD